MPEPQKTGRFDVSSALENVRRMVAACRETCQRVTDGITPRPVRSVGIVGAGIMGAAIAREHASRSIPVILMDTSPDALQRAAAELARKGDEISSEQSVVFTTDLARLSDCDIVLESIVEKRFAKQSLYAELKGLLSDRNVLATNTSTIPVGQLATGLTDPARFCGMHFCHPVRQRPLVEVICGPATNGQTLSTVVAHALSLGKLPLVVADGPGFVVNRLLMTYLAEAMEMVIEGRAIYEIDSAMVRFGMPLGPFQLLDEIGLDTALQSGVVMSDVLGDRSVASQLLLRLVKGGSLGVKSGSGFYDYPGGVACPTCEGIANGLRAPRTGEGSVTSAPNSGWRSDHVVGNAGAGRDDAVIVQRLLRPMVAQAAGISDDKLVSSKWQIDLAVIFGLGFPIWHGGLSWWAERRNMLKG
jgi:3-hydroxyacyl-CoA dehydrogenase